MPIGTKDKVYCESDNYREIAQLLKKAVVIASDFETIIDKASEDDLLFVDPPYTVAHNNNGFVKYNEKLFSWDDQLRLVKSLKRASDRKVKIISTNANHDSVKELYKSDFRTTIVSRASTISGTSSSRGKFEELLITSNLQE